jgi:hypothetical protein
MGSVCTERVQQSLTALSAKGAWVSIHTHLPPSVVKTDNSRHVACHLSSWTEPSYIVSTVTWGKTATIHAVLPSLPRAVSHTIHPYITQFVTL